MKKAGILNHQKEFTKKQKNGKVLEHLPVYK